MPRMEVSDTQFDIDELESAEYTEGTWSKYTGNQPPSGTVLDGYISKGWWFWSGDNDDVILLKFIFTADSNEGDEEEYNGLDVWENLSIQPSAKFRWAPFFALFGITIGDLYKKTQIAPEDDNVGTPIVKIGKWEVAGDDSWCRIVTAKEQFPKGSGNWQTKVDSWLPFDDADADEPEEEPEPEPTPTRRARSATSTAAKSSRVTSSAGKPAARRGPAKPAPEEPEEEPEEAEEEEAPAARRRPARAASGRAARTPAKPARSAPAARRGARKPADDNDPPF
jgi:hypothetical protein